MCKRRKTHYSTPIVHVSFVFKSLFIILEKTLGRQISVCSEARQCFGKKSLSREVSLWRFMGNSLFPSEVEEILIFWLSGIADGRWGGLGMRTGMFPTAGRPLINSKFSEE